MGSKKLNIALLAAVFLLSGCMPTVKEISLGFPFLTATVMGFNFLLGKYKKHLWKIILITFFIFCIVLRYITRGEPFYSDPPSLLAYTIMAPTLLFYTLVFFAIASRIKSLKIWKDICCNCTDWNICIFCLCKIILKNSHNLSLKTVKIFSIIQHLSYQNISRDTMFCKDSHPILLF